jgi:hypothetical protein
VAAPKTKAEALALDRKTVTPRPKAASRKAS